MSTLRDRCSLQTESKAPQIIGIPFCAGAPKAEFHRIDEFRARHADAVVPHCDPRPTVVPEEADRDGLSVRSDTVVDDICQSGIECVADATERLEKGRRER